MASHRVEEFGLSSHQFLSGINNNPSSNLIHDGPSFDFGELEQAFVLQGQGAKNKLHPHQTKQSFFSGRPAATLEMFPSWPIQFQQTPRGMGLGGRDESTDESGSAVNTHTINKFVHHHNNQLELELELELEQESSMSKKACSSTSSGHQGFIQKHQLQIQPDIMLSDVSTTALSPLHQSPQQKRKGCDSISTSQTQQLDAKTLRRLAQNREAARKSRLRKKAYVQQLESSRMKLTQLEQDLQRTRSQGLFLGSSGAGGSIVSSGGGMFDMEYARWLEEDHQHTAELRGGLEARLPDRDLRVMVDGCIFHYDEIFRLKGEAAKSDVFHLITGIWMSPAERCFLWMGGFRPSDLIKMLMSQLDPITEQQVMEIYKLQHSSQQAEDALSQGLDQLHHSLTEILTGGPVIAGINHMVLAMDKLSNLQGFVHQADILRQQILHQLYRILTIRQAAKCFLVIGEYYSKLRALSSLWSSPPKE